MVLDHGGHGAGHPRFRWPRNAGSDQYVDAVGGADPDLSVPIFEDRPHEVTRKPFMASKHCQFLVLEAKQRAVRAPEPKIALAIFENSADLIGSQAVTG